MVLTEEDQSSRPASGGEPIPASTTGTSGTQEAAFATFYEATHRQLWAYVSRSIGDAALVDDIVQETYVRLLQAPPRGESTPQWKAYVYRIATNLMHDHWRRQKREARATGSGREPPPESLGGNAAPPGTSPDLRFDVREAFARLPFRQRALLWLAYVEGYGHGDIAGMLNVGERSVRVLLFRARRGLIDLLHRGENAPEDTP